MPMVLEKICSLPLLSSGGSGCVLVLGSISPLSASGVTLTSPLSTLPLPLSHRDTCGYTGTYLENPG